MILLGPPGVGKTHLAIGLGVRTAELAGHRVYFTTAMDLAQRLTKAVDTNRLHRQLKALVQPKLLVIDEVGYLVRPIAIEPAVPGHLPTLTPARAPSR